MKFNQEICWGNSFSAAILSDVFFPTTESSSQTEPRNKLWFEKSPAKSRKPRNSPFSAFRKQDATSTEKLGGFFWWRNVYRNGAMYIPWINLKSKSSISGNQYPRDSQVQILHLKGPCRWRHYMVQPNGESALALVGNQPIPTMYEVCEQGENISLTGQEEEEGRRWQGKNCFQKGHCFFRSSKEGGRVSQYTRKAIGQELGEDAWFERDQHSMGIVEKPFVWKWFCGNISR